MTGFWRWRWIWWIILRSKQRCFFIKPNPLVSQNSFYLNFTESENQETWRFLKNHFLCSIINKEGNAINQRKKLI